MTARNYIRWFEEINKEDLSMVGGKGANLGEMVSFGINVPPGFVVTSKAYFYFLEFNNLEPKIKDALKVINIDDPQSFTDASLQIKRLILQAKTPKDLSVEIMKSYLKLGGDLKSVLVAVRSSATAEDLPGASFAGQQSTFLNVSGEAVVVKKVQACWASLFEARAIFYREQQKINHLKVGIAVPVQRMVQSEVSGVMFTADPITQQKNRIIVEAVWGLGEMIVQGSVTPDRYILNKNSLEILEKQIVPQAIELIRVGLSTKERKVPKQKQNKQKLTNNQIKELVNVGKKIHDHYFFPQDIEWALENGKIYLIQTRPITTMGKKDEKDEKQAESKLSSLTTLLVGISASPGIATGPVKIIQTHNEISRVSSGDVLVAPMTTPDFVPAMKKVCAIVTDRGGQTSHAAIVSRELGVPCVVGTKDATKILKNGQLITVDGRTGKIYKGGFVSSRNSVENVLEANDQKHGVRTSNLQYSVGNLKTATKVYVNLAEPDLAADLAKKNVDGVGLLRAEFMLAQIGVHPKKFIRERKQKLFIKTLAQGLKNFCEQFSPRPVVYRATDFKSNEYRNLIGGKQYEPEEANPMLGYRGAFRYIADPEVFKLELEAIKKVRQEFKNLYLMIPFVRQPWELAEVRKIVTGAGLFRSPSFRFWMMVEIPSNVIMIEDFIKVGIDGVSIGSNDLTMLILGTDRDNEEVAPVFNEKDPAVLWALEKVIKTCHKYKVTSSICGQAPSLHTELVDKLVEWGITSLSVNPDVIDSVRQAVYESERLLIKKK